MFLFRFTISQSPQNQSSVPAPCPRRWSFQGRRACTTHRGERTPRPLTVQQPPDTAKGASSTFDISWASCSRSNLLFSRRLCSCPGTFVFSTLLSLLLSFSEASRSFAPRSHQLCARAIRRRCRKHTRSRFGRQRRGSHSSDHPRHSCCWQPLVFVQRLDHSCCCWLVLRNACACCCWFALRGRHRDIGRRPSNPGRQHG